MTRPELAVVGGFGLCLPEAAQPFAGPVYVLFEVVSSEVFGRPAVTPSRFVVEAPERQRIVISRDLGLAT